MKKRMGSFTIFYFIAYSHDEPLSESEVDEEQLRADRQAEEERRQQEQKQREIEMARLAELEEIAQQEQEAEIARQAAELAGNNNNLFDCDILKTIVKNVKPNHKI